MLRAWLVSPETIYTEPCHSSPWGAEKGCLDHFAIPSALRRSITLIIFKDGRGSIPEAISLREQAREVEDRAISGPWMAISAASSGTSPRGPWWNAHSRFGSADQVSSRYTRSCAFPSSTPRYCEDSCPTTLMNRIRMLGTLCAEICEQSKLSHDQKRCEPESCP